MMIAIPAEKLDDEWERLSEALRPVVERVKSEDLAELLQRLKTGWASAFDVTGPAKGAAVLSIGDEPSKGRVMWIDYLVGKVSGGVKSRVANMQIVLTEIELIARRNGCAQIGGMVRRGAGWVRFAAPLGYRVEGDMLWKVL